MSTINRGPLGSAFLINRDSTNGGNHGGGNASPGSSTETAPVSLAEPTSSAAAGSKPGASPASTGAIPMPGPTLAPTPSSPPPMAAAPATMAAVMAAPGAVPVAPPRGSLVTTDLVRSLAEVKGQAQFLLYLADQIEDSLHQLVEEHDDCQNAFLCRILSMYSGQLETKHHGLGDKIAETCQEVYVTVREYDAT